MCVHEVIVCFGILLCEFICRDNILTQEMLLRLEHGRQTDYSLLTDRKLTLAS